MEITNDAVNDLRFRSIGIILIFSFSSIKIHYYTLNHGVKNVLKHKDLAFVQIFTMPAHCLCLLNSSSSLLSEFKTIYV